MYRVIVNPDKTQFGVKVGDTYIPNITGCMSEAAMIAAILHRHNVSEVHARDIVDDWLVEQSEWDFEAVTRECVLGVG